MNAADDIIREFLQDDLDLAEAGEIFPAPPRAPLFACETFRPKSAPTLVLPVTS